MEHCNMVSITAFTLHMQNVHMYTQSYTDYTCTCMLHQSYNTVVIE